MDRWATPAMSQSDTRVRRPRRRYAALFRRGTGDTGETMLEFAIVAPMLILLLLTIVDLGIMLTTQSLLDGAARDAARLIRTGQIYAQGNAITPFENKICADMAPIMSTTNCQNKIVFEVQNFTDFGSVAFNSCTQTSYQTGNGTVCQWLPGTSGSIVGVQVVYNRAYIVPWVGACLSAQPCWMGMGTHQTTGGGNTVPLIATVVFKNEPFPATGS